MKKSTIILVLLIVAVVLIYLPKVLKREAPTEPAAEQTEPILEETKAIIEQEQVPIESVAPAVSAAESVAIVNFAFNPASLTVKKGATITWTNQDAVGHTVTIDNGMGPDSALLGQGQSYSYTFNDVGAYAYHCKPHPNMRATVTVIE